jgi:hypothetical protein
MKIKLLKDIPVEEKHKLTKGKVVEAREAGPIDAVSWWVDGATGEEVGIIRGEAEQVPDDDES